MPTLEELLLQGSLQKQKLTPELARSSTVVVSTDPNRLVSAVSPRGTTDRIPARGAQSSRDLVAEIIGRPAAPPIVAPAAQTPQPQATNLGQALQSPAVIQGLVAFGQAFTGPDSPLNVLGNQAVELSQDRAEAAFLRSLIAGTPADQIGGFDVAGLDPERRARAISQLREQRAEERAERESAQGIAESESRIKTAETQREIAQESLALDQGRYALEVEKLGAAQTQQEFDNAIALAREAREERSLQITEMVQSAQTALLRAQAAYYSRIPSGGSGGSGRSASSGYTPAQQIDDLRTAINAQVAIVSDISALRTQRSNLTSQLAYAPDDARRQVLMSEIQAIDSQVQQLTEYKNQLSELQSVVSGAREQAANPAVQDLPGNTTRERLANAIQAGNVARIHQYGQQALLAGDVTHEQLRQVLGDTYSRYNFDRIGR